MPTNESPPKVILVTGSQGLLGSRLVPLLSQKLPQSQIIAVVRKVTRTPPVSNVSVVEGDLRDEALWARLPKDITNVIHLAAFIPWRAAEKDRANIVSDNLVPLANLIEHSRHWETLQQVIYSSSVSVYAPSDQLLTEQSRTCPTTLYGAAKLAGENLLSCLQARGIGTVSLRLSSLYAHGQYEGTVMPIMVNRARRGEDLLVFGDGSRTQDFARCEDAAQAVLLSLLKHAEGVYNIGAGAAVTMLQLAEAVNSVFANGAARIVFQPEHANQDLGIKLDITKAQTELGYQPQHSLVSGLELLRSEIQAGEKNEDQKG